jgi:hypothetical protein
MVAVAAAISVAAAMLAPLPHAKCGMRSRTLAASARLFFGRSGFGPCRKQRSGRVAPFRLRAVSGAPDVRKSAVLLSGTSAAMMRRCRSSELCGRGTRSVTFGRRRRSRLRRNLCAAVGPAPGSALRQSSTSVGPGVTTGSSVAVALGVRPVICPVRRSVSYQSSSADPEREVYSSRRRRRTVASGGGLSDRRARPESLSMNAEIR